MEYLSSNACNVNIMSIIGCVYIVLLLLYNLWQGDDDTLSSILDISMIFIYFIILLLFEFNNQLRLSFLCQTIMLLNGLNRKPQKSLINFYRRLFLIYKNKSSSGKFLHRFSFNHSLRYTSNKTSKVTHIAYVNAYNFFVWKWSLCQ
jgi:hypothetical protein